MVIIEFETKNAVKFGGGRLLTGVAAILRYLAREIEAEAERRVVLPMFIPLMETASNGDQRITGATRILEPDATRAVNVETEHLRGATYFGEDRLDVVCLIQLPDKCLRSAVRDKLKREGHANVK